MEAAVLAMHGLAIVAALANPLEVWVKLVLLVAIALSGPLSWHQLHRVRGITLNSEGDWEVILPSGSLLAQPGPGTLVTPWIVILGLSTERRHLTLPICRDAVDPESFRRLRVYLLIRGETP